MNTLLKFIYVIIGMFSLAFGIIGIIMPVLPTTPFLLLASFCFVKGSEKFDRWFKASRLYKNHLETFVNSRSMTKKQKISILLFADLMLMFPLIILEGIAIKIFIAIVILFKYYYFIFRIKTIDI
ncbi:YbaN family protein [Desnuesiella massiliensis]|uniref:YbaN family protein n=1 Tax=Desnuesiella massiliensis TaxID=1650662 RepID=UPI0006E19E0D|nr:YbaN family protein [Desnuesiella massiliensis]